MFSEFYNMFNWCELIICIFSDYFKSYNEISLVLIGVILELFGL